MAQDAGIHEPPDVAATRLHASGAIGWTFASETVRLSLSGDLSALGLAPDDAADALPALFAAIAPADRLALDARLRAPAAGRALSFRLRTAGHASLWRGAWSADASAAHGVALVDPEAESAGRDALTGLLDRTGFVHHLADRLAGGAGARVVCADLARFRRLNEALGHARADLVLAALAGRLAAALPPECAPARVGEDEFAVILPPGPEDAGVRLRAALERPLRIGGCDIHPVLATGTAEAAPGEAVDALELLRRAGLAVDAARAARPPSAVLDADGHSLSRLALEADLRRALGRGELEPFYQPVIRLSDGRVAGFEALVRWRHPQRGLLAPDEFLPLLDEAGLMAGLGRHMLRAAAARLALWRAELPGADGLFLSVNLTCNDLDRPTLPAEVAEVIAEAHLPAGALKLELTEGEVMRDPEACARVMQALKAAGAGLSVDDFGMGYSSLSYLARLPLDTLKVDRYFTRGLGVNAASTTVLRSIVALGQDLGLEIVAEGVETAAAAAMLAELGCGYGQGFGYAPPLDAQDATAYLLAHAASAPLVARRG